MFWCALKITQVINTFRSGFRDGEIRVMTTMNMLGGVRRLYCQDGLSPSEIERRTGLTRKALRKWLKTEERTEPEYRRRTVGGKIAPYAERLADFTVPSAVKAIQTHQCDHHDKSDLRRVDQRVRCGTDEGSAG